jgi:hypothetical protein
MAGHRVPTVLSDVHCDNLVRPMQEPGYSGGDFFGLSVEFGEGQGLSRIRDMKRDMMRVALHGAAENIRQPDNPLLMGCV